VQIACAIGEAIEALTAGLQKVSAQLEANKPAEVQAQRIAAAADILRAIVPLT
jgi:hypothetical protein